MGWSGDGLGWYVMIWDGMWDGLGMVWDDMGWYGMV
jgi:hypothetical protein